VEVDREFEPLPVAKAARRILDPLDLRVEPLVGSLNSVTFFL